MIYLYGLLESSDAAASTALKGVAGLKGPVAVAACQGIQIVFEPHDGSEIIPRRRSLLTHARVLESAMTTGTVLPMRFGMTCSSLAEIEAPIAASAPNIHAQLNRLRNRVEVGVRIVAPEPDALAAALASAPSLVAARDRLAPLGVEAHFAKAEFGRHLGEVVARRRQVAQKIVLAELCRSAIDHVLKAPESDFEVLRAEFLVDEAKVPAFSGQVERVVEALDFASPGKCAARLIGPGPAFHFVDLSLVTDPVEAFV